MVDMHTYAFVLMLVGLGAVAIGLMCGGYSFGKEDGQALAQRGKSDWRVVEIPVDAETIAFHVRHRQHEYTKNGSHEIATACIEDFDETTSARAAAERRAEAFNTRQVVPK